MEAWVLVESWGGSSGGIYGGAKGKYGINSMTNESRRLVNKLRGRDLTISKIGRAKGKTVAEAPIVRLFKDVHS